MLWRPENSDCCPDYFSHCAGVEKEEEEEEEEERMEDAVVDVRRCEHGKMSVREPQCDYQGTVIPLGHTRKDNCNNCTCQVSLTSNFMMLRSDIEFR